MITKWFTHPPPKLKPDQKHDPQRRRCYHMERKFDGGSIFSKTERKVLEDLVTHACNKYKVDRPRLVVGRSKEKVMGYTTDDIIYLNSWFHGQNTHTLLHELAHWITHELFDEYDNHGKEFMCIYGHLLDAYRILPWFAFTRLCRESRLQVARLKNPYRAKKEDQALPPTQPRR